MMDAIFDGCRVWLDVGVGEFVYEGSQVARVSGVNEEDEERVISAIRGAIHLGTMQSREQDLSFGIRELVAVGLASVSRGDTTNVFEATLRLGQVLRAMLLRDLPAIEVSRDSGGTLYRSASLSHADLVNLAFDELRWAGARYPNVAMGMLTVAGRLVEELEEQGLSERAGKLRSQAELLLRSALWADVPEEDKERLRDTARRRGFEAAIEGDGSDDDGVSGRRMEEKELPQLREWPQLGPEE